MNVPPKAGPPASPSPSLWEVAVALPLFHTLTYELPASLAGQAQVGSLVAVPVGRRRLTGYLLGPVTEAPAVKLKPIHEVLDPAPRFGPELVPLIRWLAEYYHYPIGEAVRQIIPGGEHTAGGRRERWVAATLGWEAEPEGGGPAANLSRLGARSLRLLQFLREEGPRAAAELERLIPNCHGLIKTLEKRGLVSVEERFVPAAGWQDDACTPRENGLTLVPEQEEAVNALAQGLAAHQFSPYLLHGVTASGKTEVYLAAAAQALGQGRQVLVLLPEIALTHPVAQAFRARFGGRVSLLHSGLSESQRLAQWRRIAQGGADVAVGARSAVFAPFPRLGLIVVDEEHDPAYKHEGGLPYQARDVALYRGKLTGAAVVLVSATPSTGTFFRARRGDYRYLHLSQRVTPQSLPEVHLIDLKQERGGKGLKIISRPLAASLEEALRRSEQALLFLNRRGFAAALFCLLCGEVLRCRDCSVALTQHRAKDVLECHYCGYSLPVPERCPACQSTAIKNYGVGTERVEAEVKRLFPAARVGRLDRDTASHSGKGLKIIEEFGAGEIDILVGTQMITKGHHFPGVTLVGVVAADLSLHFPEYHAGERTFQLLAQVAGRAGRGEAPGKVLIQTYNPDHYVFRNLVTQDYESFFEEELEARRTLGYPPFTRLALVRISGPQEDAVAGEAKRLGEQLRRDLGRHREWASYVRILGPAPAGLSKLKGRFRWQLLVKAYGRKPLENLLFRLRQQWRAPSGSKIDLTLDIDPAHVW